MDSHALLVLEFEKVKELLAQFASSTLGREAIEALSPFTRLEAIRESLAEVTEMARLYEINQAPPLDGLYDVRVPLRKCAISGAVLEAEEIILIGETAAAARRIQARIKDAKADIPRVRRYAARLVPCPELEAALARVFDEQKNIRDTASPALSKIRKSIRIQRSTLVGRLNRLMRGAWKEYLQEFYYTQREGRYVLPVDSRYQSKIPGIIHDRSATGTTVFIEPMEIVEDGNQLKSLFRDEELEIRKILRDLTALIAEHADGLTQNLDVFTQVDFLAAKARFSLRHHMNEPRMVDDGTLDLVNARHPLLVIRHGRDAVVPLHLTLPPEIRGLVITGPNTGGKTVVLKTVGLLALMAQSGLHIPVDATTVMPVYQRIGADIGDEQSLEQNLSTFSSHMGNIRRILEMAEPRTLVLLDELGSGTDPVEGGALSCAVLEQLRERGASFLVSTHLNELKLYAYQTEGVENGSMEFDPHTLQPTFHFQPGLPGKSNAIQIADRLGLPAPVIQRARATVERHGDAPEELLTRLGDELRAAQESREKQEEELAQAARWREEAQKRYEKARREAQDVVQRSERKAQNLIHELERRLEDLDRQEKEFREQWKAKLAGMLDKTRAPAAPPDATLNDLRETLQLARMELEDAKPRFEDSFTERKEWTWDQLQPGARVRVQGLSGPGTVRKTWPQKMEVEIQINSMNLRVKSSRVLSLLQAKPAAPEPVSTGVQVERPEHVESRVDILGMTVDEMTPVVLRYLDQAFRSGLPSVTIVHGHGTGTLRQAVRHLLRDNPVVQGYEGGTDYEGGSGVTVVKFKPAR